MSSVPPEPPPAPPQPDQEQTPLEQAPTPPPEQAPLRRFPCSQCGAELEFDPAAGAPRCPWCGSEAPIESSGDAVEEIALDAWIEQAAAEEPVEERLTVRCDACGAESTLDANVTAGPCPFCGTDIVAQARSTKLIRPRAVLPFAVTRDTAVAAFRRWIAGLWFAPNALKRLAQQLGALAGVYVPAWTFDCHAESRYSGMRGDAYWTTETSTTTERGRSVTRSRRVRRVRWSPAAGTVARRFDDVLVVASAALPRTHAEELEPWDLANLAPYDEAYLSGFRTESYTVALPHAWTRACERMDTVIRADVRAAIGGDEQRITSLATQRSERTFKHILLPMWISAYRFKEKTYRFLVNGRTGEVQGERPWSWVKITLAVLGVLAVIGVIVVLGRG